MFVFNNINLKKANNIIAKYPKGKSKSAVMPLLWLSQEQDDDNILSKEKIEYISQFLSLPLIQVYEVASFYTMYNLNDVGKYHIQICGTVPCHLVGSKVILDTCKKILGVDKNKITSDGKFSFTEVECLGACTEGPVVQINNKQYYEKLNKKSTAELIFKLSNENKLEN